MGSERELARASMEDLRMALSRSIKGACRMTIPARPKHDDDLILSDALTELEEYRRAALARPAGGEGIEFDATGRVFVEAWALCFELGPLELFDADGNPYRFLNLASLHEALKETENIPQRHVEFHAAGRVESVECGACGYTFAALHENADGTGYTCGECGATEDRAPAPEEARDGK